MEADPAPEPDADARDLRSADEHADLIGAAGTLDAETRERGDQPILEPMDEAPDVPPTAVEVKHHIGHALARAVIGEASAAAAGEHREARGLEQLLRRRAGARGVKRRVFQQPDGFGRHAGEDGLDTRLHRRHSLLIGNWRGADRPVHAGTRLSVSGDRLERSMRHEQPRPIVRPGGLEASCFSLALHPRARFANAAPASLQPCSGAVCKPYPGEMPRKIQAVVAEMVDAQR